MNKLLVFLFVALILCFALSKGTSAQELSAGNGSLIKVYAAGTSQPNLELIINGTLVTTFNGIKGDPAQRQFEEFAYQAGSKAYPYQIKLRFNNDIGPERDLLIDKIVIDDIEYQTEAETTYLFSESSNCNSGFIKTEWLFCNGYFQYEFNTTPSPSPTSMPSPTPTLVVCPKKSIGDANCDDLVNIVDFEIWRREFTSYLYTGNADFDKNGNVTAVDFEIWRKTFYLQLGDK